MTSNVTVVCFNSRLSLTARYKLNIEDKFKIIDDQCMSSQRAPPPPPTSNTSLTDELKLFYAGFDRINTEAPIKAEPPPDDLSLFFNQ